MWRNGVDRSKHRQYSIILFVIGCLFIFLAEPIRGLLIPVLNECYQNRNYFFAMILGWFVGSKDCVFPYVGFAFIASIYSLYLREETPNFEGMKKYGYGSALFFLTIGLVYSAFNGFPSMDDWFAPYLPFFMVMLNLFGQGFWLTYFILLFDRDPLEKRASKWKYRQSVRFLRLSMISLTVFLLEQTTAALYSIISKAIIPQSWFSNMYFLGIWTAVYTFSWFQLIYVWDKKKSFKYSIEWCITKLRTVKKKLPKDPLMLDYIIYIPSGFASRDFYHQQNNNKESEIQRKSCKN